MATDTEILADIDFARKSGEFDPPGVRTAEGGLVFGLSPMMRYVVAINPDMTRAQWLKVSAIRNWNKHSATKQFAQSRKYDAFHYGYLVRDDGSMNIDVDTRAKVA